MLQKEIAKLVSELHPLGLTNFTLNRSEIALYGNTTFGLLTCGPTTIGTPEVRRLHSWSNIEEARESLAKIAESVPKFEYKEE